MDNYVGKRLDGRYEIQEIIGVGGMSVVYKAYDNLDDRIVAVKILKEEFLANEEFRRRFKNESKAIAVLSHPNIVKVFDVSFGEKLQYIVMEYVDGITLKEYIQQQKVLEWREAVHFTTQILRALQHAHDKGIVHRDIKPQNIMLLQDGSIKVADFGIARFSRSETRTMTESAIGSVHYISPEQARGEITDEKADIYSVGVVLYEMTTGQVPFQSDSAVSVAIMQLQADPKLPTQLNPQIPLGLEQITMHAMQKVPAQRYQTATEMLLDMDELSRTPAATFEYTYFVDRQPTKFAAAGVPPVAGATQRMAVQNTEYMEAPPADTSDAQDAARNKKRIAIIAGSAVVVIALIVGLVVFLSKGLGSGQLTVPNFLGMEQTQVTEKYGEQYTLIMEYTATDDTTKIGKVIEQSVPEGEKVSKGKEITLKIGTSNSTVAIPQVAGMTLQEAQSALKSKGFLNVVSREMPSDTVEKGKVIGTEPAEFVSAKTSDSIIIYVSTGKTAAAFKMPKLTDLTLENAKSIIKVYNLEVGTVTAKDSDKPKDTVIEQSPAENYDVQSGMKVNLVISNGSLSTTAQAEKTVTINMKLPDTGTGGKITVYLNSVEYPAAGQSRLMDGGTYSFDLKGQGKNVSLVVQIDAKQYMTTQVNFDAGIHGLLLYDQNFGGEKVTVPSGLAGRSYASVKAEMEALGLKTEKKTESSSTVSSGNVIRYSPTGQVEKNTRITIYVSSGPANG